jgi:hypothetical protein
VKTFGTRAEVLEQLYKPQMVAKQDKPAASSTMPAATSEMAAVIGAAKT